MRGWILLGLLGLASAARADETALHYGPAPAWAKPPPAPTRQAPLAGAPLQLLLWDTQSVLRPEGEDTYFAYSAKILSPQGLALGNLTQVWDPQTESVTVNRLAIRRGDQVIDVLATDKFDLLRREQNLEQAMLDGRLTAHVEIKGLQVGDILDFAVTRTHRDPLLAGHPQFAMGLPQGSMEGRLRVLSTWTSAAKVAVRMTPDLPKSAPGAHQLDVEADGLAPLTPIDHAPGRYQARRFMQVSGFSSWRDISALMAPLYASAAALAADSPVKAEAAKIRAATPDPQLRMMQALALVQDQVRYVFVGLDSGGYRPARADDTWSRRFGDCKGKTVLLLALLKELGVEAEPVMADINGGDGLNERLPMLAFNHVLVRARVGGKSYWLDGTRSGDTVLKELETYPYGWGLPVRTVGADLERHDKPPLAYPASEMLLKVDATAGLDAPAAISVDVVLRGDAAYAANRGLAAVPREQAYQGLINGFHKDYPWIDIKTVTWAYDPARREMAWKMSGSGKMDWANDTAGRPWRWFEVDDSGFGRIDPVTRPKEQDQAASYAVNFPAYDRWVVAVRLPKTAKDGVLGFDGGDVTETIGGRRLFRRARMQGEYMLMYRSVRSLGPEITAAEAQASEARREGFKPRIVFIRAGPRPAAVESAAEPAAGDAEGWLKAAIRKGTTGDSAASLADADKALKAKPDWAPALAVRAAALTALQRFPEAAEVGKGLYARNKNPTADQLYSYIGFLLSVKETDEADRKAGEMIASFPKDPRGYVQRAMIWQARHDLSKALAAADQAVQVAPQQDLGERSRAAILSAMGRRDEAVEAAEAAVRAEPDDPINVMNLALVSSQAGRQDDARAAFDERLRMNPWAPEVWLARADAEAHSGKPATAIAQLDEALTLFPASAALLNGRCWTRAMAGIELAAAEKDCDAALAQKKDDLPTLDSRAFVSFRQGRYKDAIARYDAILAIRPDFAPSQYARGLAKLKAGDVAGGQSDIAAAKAKAPDVEQIYADLRGNPADGRPAGAPR